LGRNASNIAFHIVIIILSAAIAVTVPYTLSFVARKLLLFWSVIENEEVFMVSLEITVAILLIAGLHNAGKHRRNRIRSRFASAAGLVLVADPDERKRKKQLRRLKEEQGRARSLLIIGSTGASTFARPDSELHEVLKNCSQAKIMLLDPFSEGAEVRAGTIHDPHINNELFREQILESMRFLRTLCGMQKNIRLKLYPDPPLLKMAVLGDILSVKSYPPGIDARTMPEYIWKHDADHKGMYHLFFHYFHSRWRDSRIPEYDLRTDMLIYFDASGKEIARRPFPVFDEYHEGPVCPVTLHA